MSDLSHHVDTTAKLVKMINQIARNLVHDKDPVGATTEHVRAFWSVRMIGQLLDHGPVGLDPVAVAAFERLALGAPAEHRHDATDSADTGCDAG